MTYDFKRLEAAKKLIDTSLVLAPAGSEMLDGFYTVCADYVTSIVQKSVRRESLNNTPLEHPKVDLELLMDSFGQVKRNIEAVIKKQGTAIDVDATLPNEECFVQDLAGYVLEQTLTYKKI